MITTLQGDVIEQLRTLPDESVHCCVTSPPYWGLRDYSTEGQIGLEKTPEEYVAKMVQVFREVRRVLRRDGTCWINLGDSYASAGGEREYGSSDGVTGRGNGTRRHDVPATGLKPKDLCGIPWRVAFALQADGWVLRSEIVWSKPNPMPESCTDRPTKAHEQFFLFSKAIWKGPERGRFADISNEDARWLALCIDTEGCIVVKRVKQTDGGADAFGPQVTFGGTSRELVERFQEIVGHGNISERTGQNSPMFYWQISNNVARDFLYRIYPFLIVKQRQARIGIYVDDLVYYRGGKLPCRKHRTEAENNQLISLWSRNKECNQFGNPDLSDVPLPKYGRWDSQPYFYDADAIKERSETPMDSKARCGFGSANGKCNTMEFSHSNETGKAWEKSPNRNKRSVWTVATAPYPEAHFATYPPDLIKPCILAGTSAKGCCAKCGSPWERIVKSTYYSSTYGDNRKADIPGSNDQKRRQDAFGTRGFEERKRKETETIGWQPTCKCLASEWGTHPFNAPIPCTVLDPFAGSGTTGAVALELGRKAVLIELNPKYIELIKHRCNITPGLQLAV